MENMLKYLALETVIRMTNFLCQFYWAKDAQTAGKTFLDVSVWVFPKEVSISISRLSEKITAHQCGHHSIH